MEASPAPRTGAPPVSATSFYATTPRYDYASSMARRREELERHGATARLVEALQQCFPGGSIPSALEVGGEYATTLSVLRGRFHIGEAVSCDLVLPTSRDEGIRYVVASAEALSETFPAASFDLVLLIDVIEHLYDPDHVMDEVRRLLRPGGVLALVTPNLASWLNRALLAAGRQPLDAEVSTRAVFGRPGPRGAPPAGHIRVFTRRALREFLRYHRFELVHDLTSPLGFSHPTYVPATGASPAATSVSVTPPVPPPIEPRSRSVGWVVRVDRLLSNAFPPLASRLIVVARPVPEGPAGGR